MTRYEMYCKATGDDSWGRAPIWLNEQYFKFCDETNRNPGYIMLSSGYRLALIRPEEHEFFNAWLISTYNLVQ